MYPHSTTGLGWSSVDLIIASQSSIASLHSPSNILPLFSVVRQSS